MSIVEKRTDLIFCLVFNVVLLVFFERKRRLLKKLVPGTGTVRYRTVPKTIFVEVNTQRNTFTLVSVKYTVHTYVRRSSLISDKYTEIANSRSIIKTDLGFPKTRF